MRRFNAIKKFDIVSTRDEVDMFGRARKFRRTPSPHAADPASLYNLNEREENPEGIPEPFDQTRPSATTIESKMESARETPTIIDVSQYIEPVNLADIELPPENPKKSKKHKDKKNKSEKRNKSERKKHKEKRNKESSEKEKNLSEDSLEKRLENVNFRDDTDNFSLTIETGRTFMHDNIDDDLPKSKSNDINLGVHQLIGSDDEEYDRRFSDVKRYIPFLEMMIEKHRQMNDLKSLKKMECLYEVLTQSNKKLKMETLQRCEDVLEKLYQRVGEVLREETNTEATNDDNLSTVSSSLRNTRFHQIGNLDASFEDGGTSPMSSSSSSPILQYSPNENFFSFDNDFDDDIDNDTIIEHLESQAESPEDGEIFDISENSDDDTDETPIQSSKRDSDMSIDEEWNMLEDKPESPKQDHTWKPIFVTGHDVVTAAKLVGNNISKRAPPAPRSYTPPPAQPPKQKENEKIDELFLDDNSYDSFRPDFSDSNPRSDSPINVPEMGLHSPDPELFSEGRSNSPRRVEFPPQSLPPPHLQPIVAPPSAKNVPLISMADLEDLISNQNRINKAGPQHQMSKDEKDAEKEKEAAKAQELETVTPIRRKQTGNVKIAPMTLKLDAFITGGKDRTPSPDPPVDPRIRSRLLKEKNVDPRLSKDKTTIPPRPPLSRGGDPGPAGDMYSLHDFNINPTALSSPIHGVPGTPGIDYPPAGNSSQWNYGSNTNSMPSTPNPYGMPRDSNMHKESWDMNPNMNPNLNPNLNSNMHPNMNLHRNSNMNPNMNPNMNLNRNPNISQNPGYNNIMPLMRTSTPYPPYDSQMNYTHPPRPHQQQYPHGPVPSDNFNTNSMQYAHQNSSSWNRPGDSIRNQRPILHRDPRSMNNLRDVHRPDWDRERQPEWDWERQPERQPERQNDRDNRNRFNRDPRMRLEPLVSSPNQVKDATKDVTTAKDAVLSKGPTTTKDSTTKKDSKSATKEKSRVMEKELKKPDTKDSNKSFKSSNKSDSTKQKNKEKKKGKEKSRKSESRRREEAEKGDKLQSSLESLYGVVDTKAAAGQQVLQKFKIPKLKKPEPVLSPKTSSDKKNSRSEDSKSGSKHDLSKSKDRRDKVLQNKGMSRKDKEKEKDQNKKKLKNQEEVAEPAQTQEEKSGSEEGEESRLKSVQDLKNFINIILTQDGGRKLLQNVKMYDKFKKAFNNEELQEFKRLLKSDSESSDSDNNKEIVKKRKTTLKKRRVIVSDSDHDSEEESLAKRIGKLEPSAIEEKEFEQSKMGRKLRKRPGVEKESEVGPNNEYRKELVNEDTTQEEDNEDGARAEKLNNLIEDQAEKLIKVVEVTESNESLVAELTKARAKPRRKNSLERLQEDLKDYISSGIITAGQRTCRLAKESQVTTGNTSTSMITSPNASNLIKENDHSINLSTDSIETGASLKPKPNNKVGIKSAKKSVSNEFVLKSESEEDQPLSLRKDPVKKKKMLGPKSKRQANELALEPKILLQRADTMLEELARVNESSSDESFSLDISETTSSSKTEITKGPRTRSSAGARKKVLLNSSREDETPATDDESLTSDISLASSIASKKADKEAKSHQELLQKESETSEVVEDSQSHDKIGKKPPLKKKKKKSSWRLGVVSKARRRKKQLQALKKLQPEDVPACQSPSIVVVEDHDARKKIHVTDNAPKIKAEPENEDEVCNIDQTVKETETVVKQEIRPEDLDQIVKKEGTTMEVETPNESHLKNEELDINVDINQLIDYVCYGQEKAKCLLCFFSGKSIVHHYKTVHPGKEVSVSRLKPLEAKSASQESKDNDFKNTCLLPTNKDYHFSCRFCNYKIKGRKEESIESAYEHVTSHTGEYRFKCIECNYQSIARSTIKMHYYKNCKKLGKTVHQAIVEENVSQENRLYGYMCSLCNFIQLRLKNVEVHMKTWHQHESNSEIIKVNMSLDTPDETVVCVPQSSDQSSENTVLDDYVESTNVEKRSTRSKTRNKVEEEEPQPTFLDHSEAGFEKEEADKEARKSNLSAFVCPPELEKKNEEIELERKRKMQEIVENMGIKFNKSEVKKGISIIDKLKDRMDTTVESQTAESDFRDELDLPESNLQIVESLADDSENLICSQSLTNADISDSREILELNEKEKIPKVSDLVALENKSLEDEASDNEHPSLRYEYESSSENEDATDVNDLLKETTDIKNQSNDSMMTTIQRLAAQIQSSKPLEASGSDAVSDASANLYESSVNKEFQEAPDVLPTTCLEKQSFPEPQNISVVEEEQSQESKSDDSNPTKLFLRPRRISGDILSVPELPLEMTEPSSPVAGPSTENTETETISSPSSNVSNTVTDSFLKIENVISLASHSGNESSMMSDIRKAVETSQIKYAGLSILKKNGGPIILKRLKNPPPQSHTLTSQSIRAVNSNSNETLKLIPINISPSSSVLTTSQSNYLPIMNPATFKSYIDSKKAALPASVSSASTLLTKSTTVNPIPISKPTTISTITKTNTLTPVTIANNLTSFSINKPLKTSCYTPIKPNTFTSIKGGTITAIKSGTMSLSKPSSVVTSTNSSARKLVTVVSPNALLKQKELGPQVAVKMKNIAAYNEMMKPDKIRQLYKCMGRDCAYTTDNIDNFRRHFEKHSSTCDTKSNSLMPFDFKKCAYCCTTVNNWYQMEQHYEEKHAYCEFQCSYCFYRAITQSYVELHQINIHPKKSVAVLQGLVSEQLRPQPDINRSERVKPYVCQNKCNKYFYVPEAFLAHLRLKHSLLTFFKCHLCNVVSYSPEQLILHYKIHGIFKYQCLYCTHGHDNLTEMHNHLSTNHCNQKPIVLERTLPPQPTKSRTAIDQLLLRNAEEKYEIVSELIRVSDDQIKIESDTKKTLVKSLSEKPDASNYLISVAPTRANSPPTIKIVATESLVNKDNVEKTDSPFRKMSESISRTEKNRDSGSHFKEPELLLKYRNQDSQKAVESAVDPLGILHDTSSGDEFISMDFLDNPEFLKTLGNTSKPDDDDSDIEIIEDCEKSLNNDATMNREPPTAPDMKPNLLLNNTDKLDGSNDDASLSSTWPLKTVNFLTLDDIKHTGFTGMDLYQCGALNCNFSAPNSINLRNHIKECCMINVPCSLNNSINFQCTHCKKTFQKIGFFIEHIEIHGLKRFGCAVCGERYAMQSQALTHMKVKHKVSNYKLLPADPKNPTAEGLFIIQPFTKGKKKIPVPKFTEKESPSKSVELETSTFSPNEIDILPRQAIYNREVQCAVCRYATKVRTNIIRHLRLHLEVETVPESGPVNPVPCLDKREKMFDKMVNLASSSHQNGRMGAKPKEPEAQPEDEMLPKYVPENKRYVCGISECSYMTVNEGMLRNHLKALHSEEPFFKCTHCKAQGQDAQNISIEKMGNHLKMHDSKLYKCSHCNYFHYQRYVVERHLGDKHPEKRPFVKVIREFESSENLQSSAVEENEDETPDIDGNHWKCNACEYKCVYKAEMQTHVGNEHDEKSQFKCTVCPFRTNGKIQFEQHINSKHPNDYHADYQMVYQRVKGTKKLPESVEQGIPEEPFDTTPLWRRDMPRIKHIRGILIEEEPISKTSSSIPNTPEKLGKRKIDADISTKSAKVRCIKPVATDDKDSESGQYGSYGNPEGTLYECTICNQFKSKYKHDMRDHLYRELKYVRFHCKTCGFVSVNKNSMARHCSKNHEGEVTNCENLSPDTNIEEWVFTLLKRQTDAIKKNQEKSVEDSNESGSSKSASPLKQNTPKSPGKNILYTSNAVDLEPEDDSDVNNEDQSDDDMSEVVDEGSQQNKKPLDKPIFDPEKFSDSQSSSSDPSKKLLLICKHCKQKFNSKRGFKMHVRKQHLKQYKFLCPYCDRSANLESLIKQHIKAKHPGRFVKAIHNEPKDSELTEDFWLREYELPPGKEKRGQRRKANFEDVSEKVLGANMLENAFVCMQCNFIASTLAAHISHQKTHKMLFKCAYCSFTGTVKSEVKKHSKTDHPHLTPNVEEIPISGNSQTASRLSIKQSNSTTEEGEPKTEVSNDQKFIYWCSYCSVRCKSVFGMRKHWIRAHKDPRPNEGVKWKTGPFNYTVLQLPTTSREIVPSTKVEPSESEHLLGAGTEKWSCEYCKELCKNKDEVEHHHILFHSHLPLKCKAVDPLQIPEDYQCPECSFEAKTYELMYKHINKHIKMFKCKYCENSFYEPNQVTSHAEEAHLGLEAKIESVPDYQEQLKNMLSRITGGMGLEHEASEYQSVAKKSTARPIHRVRPYPSNPKSVARKSTNPFPRYPPGLKFSSDHANIRGISHYGVSRDPVDMTAINTYMVVGGHRMPVNCQTLSQLMDINPQVQIVDIKKGLNSSR